MCHEHLQQRYCETWAHAHARFERLPRQCPMKRRRLAELIAGGLALQLDRARAASSVALRWHMSGLAPSDRGIFVFFELSIVSKIEQETAYVASPILVVGRIVCRAPVWRRRGRGETHICLCGLPLGPILAMFPSLWNFRVASKRCLDFGRRSNRFPTQWWNTLEIWC